MIHLSLRAKTVAAATLIQLGLLVLLFAVGLLVWPASGPVPGTFLSQHTGLSVGLVICSLALFSVTPAWWLTHRLRRLTHQARRIADGDYHTVLPVTGRDEVAQLAASFNRLSSHLLHNLDTLHDNDRRFRDMADNTSDWLWEVDLDGQYLYVSKQVESLLGYRPEQLTGTSAFHLMQPDDRGRLLATFEQALANHRPFYGLQYRATHKHGHPLVFEVNGTPIFDNNAQVIGYRGVTRDITRRKEDELKLVYLAEHDALTGLLGRHRFIELLADELTYSRHHSDPVTILLVDITGFKLINDTYGPSAGDTLLRAVATLLSSQVVGGDPIARIGGDEFGILLRRTGIASGKALAERIFQSLEAADLVIAGHDVRLFAAIGICSFPDCGTDSESILTHADSAVTHAKALGHNRYHVYQPADTLLDSLRHRLNWRALIQDALEQRRLFLDYQPIYPLFGDPSERYYEALVRLKGGDDQIYHANQFIELAEETGQISDIDHWVLSTVLEALNHDPGAAHCQVAINLSGRTLNQPDACERLQRLVTESGVSPDRLIFEITETVAIQEISKAESFLSHMKSLGFRFSLDDFGAGFSSFTYLKHLPVDIIKIDGGFIRQLDRSREDQIFVRAIVQIARELGLKTVAEYVQSAATMEILEDIGVDYVQGDYLSKAGTHPGQSLPRPAAPNCLRSRRSQVGKTAELDR